MTSSSRHRSATRPGRSDRESSGLRDRALLLRCQSSSCHRSGRPPGDLLPGGARESPGTNLQQAFERMACHAAQQPTLWSESRGKPSRSGADPRGCTIARYGHATARHSGVPRSEAISTCPVPRSATGSIRRKRRSSGPWRRRAFDPPTPINVMSLRPAPTERRPGACGSPGPALSRGADQAMLSASVTLRRCQHHETLGPAIEVGVLAVQLRHRFVDPNRHSE
jgi:hypothetical protein